MRQEHNAIKSIFSLFVKEIKGSSDLLYCLILTFYYLSVLSENVHFIVLSWFSSGVAMQAFSVIVLLLLGIYLSSIFIMVIQKKWAIFVFPVIIAGILLLCAKMQRDKFDGLMIMLLIFGAYGKKFEKLQKVLLYCTIGMVIIAIAGIPIGLTVAGSKVGKYGTGLAFGFVHPNVFGSYVFFIVVSIWYLYIRKKQAIIEKGYFVFSWIMAVFMVYVPKCRTQALLLLLFPISVQLSKLIVSSDRTQKRSISLLALLWILIASPIVFYLVTFFLGSQREWLVAHTFGTYIENFSKRFIQAGLAFKEHGFPLFGEPIRFQTDLVEILDGHTIKLYVLDNGYVVYTILRGMIWMVPAILWICYANWKIIQKNDYGLLAISVLLCLMGLMEPYAFTMYNYIFLYPLAISSVSAVTSCSLDRMPGQREIIVEETEAGL